MNQQEMRVTFSSLDLVMAAMMASLALQLVAYGYLPATIERDECQAFCAPREVHAYGPWSCECSEVVP